MDQHSKDVGPVDQAGRADLPWHAKALAGAVAAYALSPIDLIPHFIPVLGYLDDLVIVPFGIMAAVRLIPPDVLAELRSKASELGSRPVSGAGLAAMIAIWAVVGLALLWWAVPFLQNS